MITRRDAAGRLECIRQHDHAAISGALAEAWIQDTVADAEVRYAVTYHDVAWVGLDLRARPRADGLPHTFLDQPLAGKYTAYRAGIDLIATGSAYAGYLCSRHYARFASMLDDELSTAYLAHERGRQEQLLDLLEPEQRRTGDLHLALLQLLDALSLFVCCNPPGETRWSWYPDGFHYGPWSIRVRWHGPERLELDPNPLGVEVRCRYPAFRWDASQRRLADEVSHTVVIGGRG